MQHNVSISINQIYSGKSTQLRTVVIDRYCHGRGDHTVVQPDGGEVRPQGHRLILVREVGENTNDKWKVAGVLKMELVTILHED